jgi:hypothetical protein
MANPVLVDKSIHDTRIITEHGAIYGDNQHAMEVVPREFSSLCAYYPIMIVSGPQNRLSFVAVLGLEQGENLFLEGDRWDAGYVPLTRRRQPFTVVPRKFKNEEGSEETAQALAIDMDSPRISATEGEALVDAEGAPTPYFREINAIVQATVNGAREARELLQKLASLDLIEALDYGVRLSDGKLRRLEGLSTINEKKLRELDSHVIVDLHKSGFLDAIYCMRASLGHVGALARRKEARLQSAG